MNGNSSDEVISNDDVVINNDDNTILLPRDEMIIDIHQDLKDPSVLGKGLFGMYDFVQTEDGVDGDDVDSSLPPIGRSRTLFRKFSKKPPRPIITPKATTNNTTQDLTTNEDSTPPPSEITKFVESKEVEPVFAIEPLPSLTGSPVLCRETAINSLLEYYSKFYSIVPNYGVGQVEKQFLQLYFEYMLDKNTEKFPSPIPMLRSAPLDFYHLYGRVLEKGGWAYMNTSDWELVFKNIRNHDELMKNPEEILKSLYIQYLKHFEGFVARQPIVDFNNTILEYIQKQNLEEFHNKTTEFRKRIFAQVRNNCEKVSTTTDLTTSSVNNEKKAQVVIDSSDDDGRLPMPELPKKLTKNVLQQMQKTKKRAYLSFISKGKTINLKIDVYSTPLGLELLRREPIIGDSASYGQLIYYVFDAAQISKDETIRKECKLMGTDVIEPGSLCYWMGGSSIIFGYGQTPESRKQECRLTEKCAVFGKLNDPNYTFEVSDSNSSLYLPSVLHDIEKNAKEWTVKLSSHPPISEEPVPLKKRARAFVTESPRKKVDITPSESLETIPLTPQKETPKQVTTTPTKEPIPVVIIDPITPTRESTTKEIPKESPREATTPISDDSSERKHLTLSYRYQGQDESSCKTVTTSFVAREFIDYSTINSLLRRDNVNIQNLSQIRYTLESSVWQILHDNFKLKLAPNQTIQLLLFRTMKSKE